ncbi:MAG TPA: type II secretion system protein GspD, partial [Stellaceae bacterium]|nr:type II secretion system protein GspD [Stellaceae bacterium]
DEKNNTLVFFARPRDYQMIEDALKRIDVAPLQVLIEATIAEVTLNDNLQYGLQWFFKSGNNTFSNVNPGNGNVTITPAIIPGFNYQFLTNNVNVILSALSAVTTVNVVSSPQLLVLDHHSATLQVGDEVPVPTAQIQSTLVTGAPVVNTIQYLNTGVILHVSPRVNANGVITLEITQEVSDVIATTTSTLNAPTISQRRVESTVSVLDGETVALGGLIQDSRTIGRTGIPILSDIPLLGALFSTRQDQKMRTELLVLLSPRVLHDANEARRVTDELRGRLHTIEPLVDRTH